MKTRSISLSIISLLVVAPLFISVSYSGALGFDRMGGVASEYFATVPVSFFLGIFLFCKYWRYLFASRIELFLFAWLIFGGLAKATFAGQVDYSYIKIAAQMMTFLFVINLFSAYFANHIQLDTTFYSIESTSLFGISLLIFLIVVVSIQFLDRGAFISNDIMIYNFEQYYALSFILLAGAAATMRSMLAPLIFLGSFLLASYTANSTAVAGVVVLGILWIGYLCRGGVSGSSYYLCAIILLISIFSLYVGLLFILDQLNFLGSASLQDRLAMIKAYFSTVEYYNIFLPFLSPARGIYSDMHNELLEVFYASGVVGVIIYYGSILKRLLEFHSRYYALGLAVTVVVFLGGTTVENTLHPYMMMCIAYYISFCLAVSRKLAIKDLSSPDKNVLEKKPSSFSIDSALG